MLQKDEQLISTLPLILFNRTGTLTIAYFVLATFRRADPGMKLSTFFLERRLSRSM